jgi:hypothetical protein
MKKIEIIQYHSNKKEDSLSEFEEALFRSLRQYSIRHLQFENDISPENILEAIQKSLNVCHLAGINSQHHFKKIYVFDADINSVLVDWQMTKSGFNLMLMNIPTLNEKKAQWLWKLADL